MTSYIPTLNEFLTIPSTVVHDLVYPHSLSISLLLNGTRRWYVSQYFDAPPKDNSYFPHYLETVLVRTSQLLFMLAEHGLQRIFIPVYSEHQKKRQAQAYDYLLKGITALTTYPALVDVYRQSGYMVRFYGNMSQIGDESILQKCQPLNLSSSEPRHTVYYGVETGNPHTHLFQLAFEFGVMQGRPPSWDEILELYYGDRTVHPINILVAFSRIYARQGIPPLLEGEDRIYSTVVTPLVLSQTALRRIVYDYLFNRQNPGRDYRDIHPNEVQRLKRFYADNQETVIGLMEKYEDLCYPVIKPIGPAEDNGRTSHVTPVSSRTSTVAPEDEDRV